MRDKLDAIFFDLDGTLLNTSIDLANALNDILIVHGKSTLSFDIIHPITYLGAQAIITKGFGITPKDPIFNQLRQQFLIAYQNRLTEHTHCFPGIETVIEYLKSNQIPWGIITNKPRWLTKPLLDHFPEIRHFHCLVCGDSLTNRKPHPEPLLFACRLTKSVPRYSVYIGDTYTDISAAKSAGMIAIFANYDNFYSLDQTESTGADFTINHPTDFIHWLSKYLI